MLWELIQVRLWCSEQVLRKHFYPKHHSQIDIERLMTRLQGEMPYDREHEAHHEFALLLSDLKRVFNEKIVAAKNGEFFKEELEKFAKVCLLKKVNFITFNYDDILDEALYSIEKASMISHQSPYWHPDGGYGFFCKPARSVITDTVIAMDKAHVLLLKLHGSLNWRIKKGYEAPYLADSIVHKESWLSESSDPHLDATLIDVHLEKDAFIVPPLLTKDILMRQPIFRILWGIAYEKLKEARQVIFLGYSMPITDIATGFLFREALQSGVEILVVSRGSDANKRDEIKARYKKLFPQMKDSQFLFEDAKDWCIRLVQEEASSQLPV